MLVSIIMIKNPMYAHIVDVLIVTYIIALFNTKDQTVSENQCFDL